MRVLIAHSSETVRQEAWAVLDQLGWEVVEADDPMDAVRLCSAELPQVALLEADLAWPQGGSLIERFRADRRLANVRVIVFEDQLDVPGAIAGLESGADEFLVEPVSPSDIAVRVQTAARLQQLQAQLDDQQAELRELIHTDSLTRLFNRRYLLRQIVAQINSARRHGLDLAVLLVDLDSFKAINDTRGHAEGDAALQAVAGILESRLRDTDVAGRWGGDEFLVLLPGTDADAAMAVARDLGGAVRELERFPELTLSVGCAAWEDDDPAGLVARADEALYEAKRAGRDGVRLARRRHVEIRVAASPEPASTRAPLRVLVVDDVEGIRSLIRLTLEGPVVEIVGEAADGAAAVALALELRPDVVIMDWNMPGTDGVQATRTLHGRCPDIRVVAFTSTEDRRIHRALMDAGALAHFGKGELGRLADFLADLHGEERPSGD